MVTGSLKVPVHEHGGCRGHRLRCTRDQRPPGRGQRHGALYLDLKTNLRVADGFIVREPAGCTSEQAIHVTTRHRNAESSCRKVTMRCSNNFVVVYWEDALN